MRISCGWLSWVVNYIPRVVAIHFTYITIVIFYWIFRCGNTKFDMIKVATIWPIRPTTKRLAGTEVMLCEERMSRDFCLGEAHRSFALKRPNTRGLGIMNVQKWIKWLGESTRFGVMFGPARDRHPINNNHAYPNQIQIHFHDKNIL